MLRGHPEAFVAAPKELRFFSHHNWHRGVDWYASHFRAAGGAVARGEASPVYTWAPQDPEIPTRIRDTLGDIRYVYLVRDPVDRVVSHYRHAVFHRWIEPTTTIDDAIRRIPALVDCSRYATQLERFDATTEADQWHVIVFEEFVADHRRRFADLCRFLGIDDGYVPPLAAENVSATKRRVGPRTRPAGRLGRTVVRLADAASRRAGWRFGSEVSHPAIDDATRDGLRDRLRPEIERLGERLGRDLPSSWG